MPLPLDIDKQMQAQGPGRTRAHIMDDSHMLFPLVVLLLTRANGDLEVTRAELMAAQGREVQVFEPDNDRLVYRLLPRVVVDPDS